MEHSTEPTTGALHQDRLFASEPNERAIARQLYNQIKSLPLVCPHGHTDPQWFAANRHFNDPTELLVLPDHYVLRMLFSHGVSPEQLGLNDPDADRRVIWRLFAAHYYLFRGTPTRLWMDQTFIELFGITRPLNTTNADYFYDHICDCLAQEAYRPRALYERFNIEVIATTEAPNDPLKHHQTIQESGWSGRVISTYRPDPLVDPDYEGFSQNLDQFGELTGEDTHSWQGYLNAHRQRREYFKHMGATSTDHGHPTAQTGDLSPAEAQALFNRIRSGRTNAKERELFRAQMLTEMATMSIEDGMVMQLHPGSFRNHNASVFERFGRDKGFDIPHRVSYVSALKPLLDRHGMNTRLSLILFTLDESTYSRELAPLAGVYPSIKLGPAWWFFDSPGGMLRYRELVTETAGFYNCVGFNDDTRALPSIAARHDVSRRVDCAYLAGLVTRHLLSEDEAHQVAEDLAYKLAKKSYKL